ncbi:AAA family ATPase [Streptomyces hydrogenans]|uniref:AAA family ATPase n=2 Tax=Streptomyces hydrogenans TaxID=1873719 RepID=A0ABQ3PJN4_9ACTN|nr:AAA family ATPase [Streptomyces hydrogenans]GHG10014.1 hypothetical protein GCM10018784_23350 [Streptomyces hydrogenans]GHI25213.1 hypothetical protein Shyd_65840 [Streptomyces hydrogenans]
MLPGDDHEAFDRSYQVQATADGEARSAVDRRAEDFIRDATAKTKAADEIARREKEALYKAAEAGDNLALLDTSDLDQLEEAEPLIEGFLVKESIARLYGPPKSYKSFVMLDMAGCVGAGIPWQGKRTEQSNVLYIVAEGVRGIKRRVRAWEMQNKRPMTGVHFYPNPVQLGDRKDVSALIRTAKRGDYKFVVLDTQARCTVGLEENSASEMGMVVAALDVLKEVTGACVALVHHSGASAGRARGSTAILGALDAEFEVEADKDTYTVTVHTRAQKDLAEAPEMKVELGTAGPGLALAVKPRRQWYQQRAEDLPPLPAVEHTVLNIVVAFAAAGATEQMINSRTSGDADKATVREALGQLLVKGCVARQGSSWKATSLGQRRIGGLTDDS